MKKKLNTAVIIGPSGIGAAYLRELINFGIKNIGVLGKKYKRNRLKNIKENNKQINFFNLKNIQDVKKIKPDIINICSPTKYHFTHIKVFKKISEKLIVEKPFFWIKNKKKNNSLIANQILSSKDSKIFVNFPMISLANQIKKYSIKKPKKLTFYYFTNGKHRNDDIAVDLLPHAFSFVLTLFNYKQSNFKIINVKKNINSWNCEILIENCLCKFFFRQNIRKKSSELGFSLDKNNFVREQFLKKGIFINRIIQNKTKIIKISNPMTENLKYILKNIDRKIALINNKNITINSLKFMEKLINYK